MPRNLFTSVLLFLGLGAGPAPASEEVQALTAELQRIREAFLRP